MKVNNLSEETQLSEEGKKDACYHKVKSRYSVGLLLTPPVLL